MSKKPIEIIKNYDFKPSQIYEKDGGLFATIQENIISQIVEARDEEYYNFLIKQIRDFIVKNNIETCFVINKEELIDCIKEHNKLHCEILNLQSQLDQANERLKGAIVPKFKIGQEIWYVGFFNNIESRIVNRIELDIENNKLCELYKLEHYGTDDYSYCIMPFDSDRYFSTEQEAQTKLQELRGGE